MTNEVSNSIMAIMTAYNSLLISGFAIGQFAGLDKIDEYRRQFVASSLPA